MLDALGRNVSVRTWADEASAASTSPRRMTDTRQHVAAFVELRARPRLDRPERVGDGLEDVVLDVDPVPPPHELQPGSSAATAASTSPT